MASLEGTGLAVTALSLCRHLQGLRCWDPLRIAYLPVRTLPICLPVLQWVGQQAHTQTDVGQIADCLFFWAHPMVANTNNMDQVSGTEYLAGIGLGGARIADNLLSRSTEYQGTVLSGAYLPTYYLLGKDGSSGAWPCPLTPPPFLIDISGLSMLSTSQI